MTNEECGRLIGYEVHYIVHDGARPELGVLYSMPGSVPFVLFLGDSAPKATPPNKLKLRRWIKCAAIKHADGRIWSLPRPSRHSDIIRYMKDGKGTPRIAGPIGDWGDGGFTQGFLAGDDSFVDRQMAARIAAQAGQLIGPVRLGYLTTEEVW